MKERLDQRVLGAVRWVDQLTGRPVARALQASSDQARFRRNAGDLAVIWSATRLERHGATVFPPLPGPEPADELTPPPASITVTGEVVDPLGEYLPRRFSVELPRNTTATRPWPANSVFRPVEVALLPAAGARLSPGWAELRVTLRRAAGGALLPNVLVRVRGDLGDGAQLLGVGMSDAQGEALVALTDLPLYLPDPDSGKLVPTELDLTVELVPPPGGQTVVDWTALLAVAALPANIHPAQHLDSTRRLSLSFAVTT